MYWTLLPTLHRTDLVCLNNLRDVLPIRKGEATMRAILWEVLKSHLTYCVSSRPMLPVDLYLHGGPVAVPMGKTKEMVDVYAFPFIMPRIPIGREKMYFMRVRDLQVFLQMNDADLAKEVCDRVMSPPVAGDILAYACQSSDIPVKQ